MQLILGNTINKDIAMHERQMIMNSQLHPHHPQQQQRQQHQFYDSGKFEQMSYAQVPAILAPRMNTHRPVRRRRSTHSLVATMDPVAVARRNERERNRVKLVNDGFDALRKKVPFLPDKKKLSKVEILRYAMTYINDLQCVVEEFDQNNSEQNINDGSLSSLSNTDDDCSFLEQDLDDESPLVKQLQYSD